MRKNRHPAEAITKRGIGGPEPFADKAARANKFCLKFFGSGPRVLVKPTQCVLPRCFGCGFVVPGVVSLWKP
jgi:hypothetical protein